MSDESRKKLGAAFWALVLASAGVASFMLAVAASEHDGVQWTGTLDTFSSVVELQEFVESTRSDSLGDYYSSKLEPATDGEFSEDSISATYSTTNVQVAGVDEADIVKTNGEQIFLASHERVAIVEAEENGGLTVVSAVGLDVLSPYMPMNSYQSIGGLFVVGDRLVILLDVYEYEPLVALTDEYDDGDVSYLSVPVGPASYAVIVDVSVPPEPEVLSATGISGYVQAGRLVDGVVYLVTAQSIWSYEDGVPLPAVYAEGDGTAVDASDVMYDPDSCYVDSYVNVLSLDVFSGDFGTASIMSSWASTVYMTTENLYITFQKWSGDVVLASDEASPADADTARTTVYKLAVDGLSVQPVAEGEVKGWLLNQFSMDERSGFLRLATTTSWKTRENAVYILDANLQQVGEVTGLAPTEQIFSVRFVEDMLYLVTFLQVDPLFVIALSDPYAPEVLGELEVPGFSTYLHPIGDGLLIGVGRDGAWAKVSVFDVSDPAKPAEVDTARLGEELVPEDYEMNSYSEAEWDHKAFMYDQARRMLVLPVCVIGWDYADVTAESYTYTYRCGFCVFSVSEEGLLEHVGFVEHPDGPRRSLYIEDTLYTVSEYTLSASSIPGLELISSVDLAYEYYDEAAEEPRD